MSIVGALLATLTFAGLRLGELLDLRWRDVDLAVGRLRIGDAKTEAEGRDETIRLPLRDELATLKASVRDAKPEGRVFGTANGRRQSESNIRGRVVELSVKPNC